MVEDRAWGKGGKGSLQRGLKHIWRGRSEPRKTRVRFQPVVVNNVKGHREVKPAMPQECSWTLPNHQESTGGSTAEQRGHSQPAKGLETGWKERKQAQNVYLLLSPELWLRT